jgi:large repetitive protein
MTVTSKYFVLTPNGDNLDFLDFDLRYGSVTTVGASIQFNGSSRVDGIFVRPGLTYDLTTTAAGTDKIFFTGNLASYSMSVAGNTFNLSRTVNAQSESVTLAGGTSFSFDTLVFANGSASSNAVYSAIKNATMLPTLSTTETSSTPQGAATPGATLSATVKAYSTNTASVGQVAETFATTKPGIAFYANGGNGIDTVYVSDGATVDATVLGASVDLVYFRGQWADYTKATLSSGTQLLFTRAIGGHLESVTVTSGNSFNHDKLIFADGALTTDEAKTAITTDPTGPGPTDPTTVTPLYPDDQVLAALNAIRDAAQNDSASANTPSALTYVIAGVTGVGTGNLASINSALNSTFVNGVLADTAPEVQSIVSAYQAILNSADGAVGNTSTALTSPQYTAIGVTGVSGTPTPGSAMALLNDVVDASPTTAVDTVPELQAMVTAAAHVMTGAAGGSAPTLADLIALGITGVTAGNLTSAQAGIAATADNGTGVDTQAELQAAISATINSFATLSSTLDGVSNLDITSNLVFSADNSVSVGSGYIHITDLGGAGYLGDTSNNTQTINVATAIASNLMSITGSGASTKIVINPLWDLDLASNYQITIDDGAFMNAAGTVTAAHLAPIYFSTITPGTHVAGTAASEAIASQTMVDASGALATSKSWLSIEGIGNNTGGVTQLGDLSSAAFALVLKNYATTRGGDPAQGGDSSDGIATHDTNVGVVNFGNDDILYIDSQTNNTSTQFFDARYTQIVDGANVGGLSGQNTLVLGLVPTPQQSGSTAMVLLGLEGNTANTTYLSVVSLPDGSVGWANVWHNASAAVVMG